MNSDTERADHSIREVIAVSMAEGELPPRELAEHVGLSLSELAEWANDPASVRMLSSIAFLADVRAQMVVARYRANAAAQLIAIATSKEPSELSRKACVDLLNMNLNVFLPPDAKAKESPAPPSEKAILDALEKLGE